MIYTVTFNPSIDYVVTVPGISYEDVNRVQEEYILPGGKGINVSRVLHNLGVENMATGFVAGFTGDNIVNMLKECGVYTEFITVKEGMSRINVKIKAEKEGEINGRGPNITTYDVEKLYKVICRLKEGDYLVLGGNVQSTVSSMIYGELAGYAAKAGARCVVDASGSLLSNALSARPFLIKPNKVELEDLCGRTLNSMEEIIDSAKSLRLKGAQNVLVSLAEDGAVLVTEEYVYCANAPQGRVVNSVGAGDSMVAGFLAGYIKTCDYKEALKLSICAGSASAFVKELATAQEIYSLSDKVDVSLTRNGV